MKYITKKSHFPSTRCTKKETATFVQYLSLVDLIVNKYCAWCNKFKMCLLSTTRIVKGCNDI